MRKNNKLILGAIGGDIIGSIYEFYPYKNTDFQLFTNASHFTDDTVMTVANMAWLLNYKDNDLISIMHTIGNKFTDVGYGQAFAKWLITRSREPYFSCGNGSSMRCSPVGWMFDTLDDVLEYAKKSADVTHNHPEGIKGAQSVAAAIFLARTGRTKETIKDYISKSFGYDLDRKIDDIRPNYSFKVTCQESTPEAIICFLESTDYESAVRLAISLGGDADTQAAIAGSIAEAYYGIPYNIQVEIIKRLPKDLLNIVETFSSKIIFEDKKVEDDNQLSVTVTQETSWKRALNAARRTIGKEPVDKEPSDNWKAKVLLAEHSPIKLVEYLISFKNLRQWVGVHLLRHDFTLPFVHSQREDRRELNCSRDDLPQGTPNDQDFVVNAQTLINISRKRLCTCASKETREAWQMVKDEIAEQDEVMADKMVRNCVYRGFCPELNCCGYVNSERYKEELNRYRKTDYAKEEK